MTDPLWVYVDTSKQAGDPDHLKVFSTTDAVRGNDLKAWAFEYEILE
jgi:hypothetical protein